MYGRPLVRKGCRASALGEEVGAVDRGVFVMLESRLPSRLLGAFPTGVSIERIGLAEAIAAVGQFLGGHVKIT
jgi:hypothetical protein